MIDLAYAYWGKECIGSHQAFHAIRHNMRGANKVEREVLPAGTELSTRPNTELLQSDPDVQGGAVFGSSLITSSSSLLNGLEDLLDGFPHIETAAMQVDQVGPRSRMICIRCRQQLIYQGQVNPSKKRLVVLRVGVGGRDDRHAREVGHVMPSSSTTSVSGVCLLPLHKGPVLIIPEKVEEFFFDEQMLPIAKAKGGGSRGEN